MCVTETAAILPLSSRFYGKIVKTGLGEIGSNKYPQSILDQK